MPALRQQILATVVTNPQSAQPLMVLSNVTPAYVGTLWNSAVWGTGGAPGGYGYNVIAKPAWVNTSMVSGFMLLSGIPTNGGSGLFTVDVTDSAPTTQRKSFYIQVQAAIAGAPGDFLVSSRPLLPIAYVQNPFEFDVRTMLINPVLPVAATITAGTLPTGMSIGPATGIITASSVTGTTQDVNVHIVDASGAIADIPLHLIVAPRLAIGAWTPRVAVLGVDHYDQIPISGGSGQYHVEVDPASPSPMPAGLEIESRTGKLGGRATALTSSAGPPTVQFRVIDLVTGEERTTAISPKKITVASVFAPAPRGSFAVADQDGALSAVDVFAGYFGGGVDGDFVLDGTNNYLGIFQKIGSVYSSNRPIYARSIEVGTGCTWEMNGNPAWVSDDLDITAANCKIINNGNSSFSRIGAGGQNSDWFGGTSTGGDGGLGATTGAVPGAGVTPTVAPGGIGSAGNAGAGGAGTGGGLSGAGGLGQDSFMSSSFFPLRAPFLSFTQQFGTFNGGTAGAGGGAGGGNGLAAGANGGGGGAPGRVVFLFAHTITTSASTSAATFQAKGGNGFAGVAAPGANRGAGGGGSGASGGIAWIVCAFRDGPQVVGLIDVSGGNAGLAGATGAGFAAVNGNPGTSGFAFAFVLSTGVASTREITAGIGTTGGIGTLTW